MRSEETLSMESHRSAATLYITGELTTHGVMCAIGEANELPDNVRALCIDLRGVRKADPNAMRILQIGLREWRSTRRGMSRVKLADGADGGSVALQFTHQRWTRRSRFALPAPRPVTNVRIRDYRQAVVTRSLRERAGSETK